VFSSQGKGEGEDEVVEEEEDEAAEEEEEDVVVVAVIDKDDEQVEVIPVSESTRVMVAVQANGMDPDQSKGSTHRNPSTKGR
jgi:hypothetical protein